LFVAGGFDGGLRSCVVDRHYINVDPDPDPIFHFDADPDPTLSFTYVCRKIRPIFVDLFTAVLVYLVASCSSFSHRCQNFQYYGQCIEIFWKKQTRRLALHFVEIDTGTSGSMTFWCGSGSADPCL
jgi:hypothetical protein